MSQVNTPSIRISAKAIVIHKGKILLIRYRSDSDDWYTLPGGGQLFGETLPQTLVRECLEETKYHVETGRLVFVREYIGANHEFSELDSGVHQIEMMFLASLSEKSSDIRALEISADKDQIGAHWVRLDDVDDSQLFPAALRHFISAGKISPDEKIYLGDVN